MHATLKRRVDRLEDRSDAGSSEPRKAALHRGDLPGPRAGLRERRVQRDALSRRLKKIAQLA
jgi:hypothetical protein